MQRTSHTASRRLAAFAAGALLSCVCTVGFCPSAFASSADMPRQTGTALCMIARATAVVEAGATPGSWTVDAAAAKTSSANVDALCRAVNSDERLSVTLTVSPLLLERWVQASAGGNQDATDVMADLQSAMGTGRLELVHLGYGDPDLACLGATGYTDDIAHQYQETEQALTSLTFSTGTVPAGLSFSETTASGLVSAGVTWAAVDAAVIDTGTTSATSGLFTCRNERELTLLAVDTADAEAFSSSDSSDATALLQQIPTGTLPGDTYATMVDLSGSSSAGSDLVALLKNLAGLPGYHLSTASDAVAAASSGYTTPPVATVSARPESTYTQQYLDALTPAQKAVTLLRGMLYSTNTKYDETLRTLLVSEGAGFSDENTAAALADSVGNSAATVLEGVTVDAEDMTLAGTSGTIPFTITNDADTALEVTIVFEPGSGVTVTDDKYASGYTTILYTGQNTFSVPVACSDEQSSLSIAVTSGDSLITGQTIAVHTSHINEVTLIVCGVALVGVVIFLVRQRKRRMHGSVG